MTMTYHTIKLYLDDMGVTQYHDKKDAEGNIQYISAGFKSSDTDEKPETVFIELQEDGKFLRIFEPQRYTLSTCQCKEQVFEALLKMNYDMKMIKWEFDPSDGEIRASIEIPIEDSAITQQQFSRALMGLINMMDQSHDYIQNIIHTAKNA